MLFLKKVPVWFSATAARDKGQFNIKSLAT